MTKTKKSLLMSAVSLLLCISMLIGSTFAWFTDSVTSAGNKIQSGTLKVDLELLDKKTGEWNSLKESQAPIFNYDKWEPGYVDTKILKVENEGNLALKWVAKFYSEYQLSILADVIDVYVCPSETELAYPESRDLKGYTCVGNLSSFINSIGETTYGTLNAGESAYLGLALKMREEAGNEYQGLSLGGAFDIRIYATQFTSESDSFDNQYDKNATFDILSDKAILTSQVKYLKDGAESVDFALYYKGTKIVSVSVPAGAVADPSKPVTVTVDAIEPQTTVSTGNNTLAYAYDIDVSNLKTNIGDNELVTVVVSAPNALAAMQAYHSGVLIDDAVYDEVAGTITFKTASFSPYAFTSQVEEVSDLAGLRAALQKDGYTAKLTANIEVDLTKGTGAARDAYHAYPSNDTPKYYNGVMINGQNVGLDLNGHSITALCGDEYNSNDDVGALFFVGKDGSLNITDTVGTGFIKMRSSIYAVWAPYADPSYVDIYSGIFIADSYAGDPVGTPVDSQGNYDPVNGTMSVEQENTNRALIYAGTGGNINVYGGYFLYNNTVNDKSNRNNGAFNAKDYYEDGALITIHEGVYLSNKEYRQNPYRNPQTNPSFDDYSVVLSQYGEVLDTTVTETIKIGEKDFTHNWYKVTPTYKYKVIFMNGEGTEVIDTQYIMSNTGAITIEDIDDTARGNLGNSYANDFGGWVNAGSQEVETISAGNTKDFVLYPTHEAQFTVRWLNEDGNVIATAQTSGKNPTYSSVKSSEPVPPPKSKYGNMEFAHWEIREVKNGNTTYKKVADNPQIKSDTTIYPFYNYNGKIGLTPHDTDSDGRPNYYTVESATGLEGEVVIPGYVNGVQVTVVADLTGEWNNSGVSSIVIEDGVKEIGSKAFAMTSSLKNVEIPASVTTIGANAFADTVGGTLISKKPTITYHGTWAEWESIQKANGWERGLATGTKVVCTDGIATLKATEYLLYSDYAWTFVAN